MNRRIVMKALAYPAAGIVGAGFAAIAALTAARVAGDVTVAAAIGGTVLAASGIVIDTLLWEGIKKRASLSGQQMTLGSLESAGLIAAEFASGWFAFGALGLVDAISVGAAVGLIGTAAVQCRRAAFGRRPVQ